MALKLVDRLKSKDRGMLVIIAAYLVTVTLGLTPWIYSDGVGDYAWVRTVFMDGDLDCSDEFVHFVNEFKFKYGWPEATNDLYPVKTSTGYQANKYAIGSAILWSPFFMVGHGVTYLSNALFGSTYALNGYSKFYIFFVTLGSSFYALLGLLLSYKLCKTLFDERTSLLATLAVWFASSVPVYMYLYPSLPHNMSLFTVTLFFFYWYMTREDRTHAQWAILGALGGLMFMTRLETAVLLIIPVIDWAIRVRKSSDRAGLGILAQKMGLYTVLGFAAGFPQLYVWQVIFGRWFLNPYSKMHQLVMLDKFSRYGMLPSNEPLPGSGSGLGSYFHFISHPDIGATLFGSSYGIFTWTPILLLAVIGFYFLYRRSPKLAGYSFLALVLLVYITSCSKKAGMSFGDRYLIKASPFFIIGLAALFEKLKPYLKFKGLVAIVLIFIAWNGLFIVQYATGLVNRQGAVEWKQMIANQFTTAPGFFIEKAKPFLTGRSSAYRGNEQVN